MTDRWKPEWNKKYGFHIPALRNMLITGPTRTPWNPYRYPPAIDSMIVSDDSDIEAQIS